MGQFQNLQTGGRIERRIEGWTDPNSQDLPATTGGPKKMEQAQATQIKKTKINEVMGIRQPEGNSCGNLTLKITLSLWKSQ